MSVIIFMFTYIQSPGWQRCSVFFYLTTFIGCYVAFSSFFADNARKGTAKGSGIQTNYCTFTNSWSVLAPASSLAPAKHLKRIFPSPISLVATISLHTVVTATIWQWTKIQSKLKMVMFAQLQPAPAPGYCRLCLLSRWLPWTPGPLPCYPHKWPT